MINDNNDVEYNDAITTANCQTKHCSKSNKSNIPILIVTIIVYDSLSIVILIVAVVVTYVVSKIRSEVEDSFTSTVIEKW